MTSPPDHGADPTGLRPNADPEDGARIDPALWDRTPLGPRAEWPRPLKALFDLMSNSLQPMFIAWGPDNILLYNDAYAPVLAGKHPSAMGRPVLEVWDEVREDIRGIVEAAASGHPVRMDDIVLRTRRKGFLEEAHFAFSYTPVQDETGAWAGFFCIVTDTTPQTLAEGARTSERQRLLKAFDQAPGFICTLMGPDHVFEYVNATHHRIFNSQDWVGKPVRVAFPDIEGQGFFELLDRVYQRGERIGARDAEARFRPDPGEPEVVRYLDFVYAPLVDDAGKVVGIFCEGFDVTAEHLAREALKESQERERTAAERVQLALDAGAIVGTWVWDVVEDRLTADERFAETFGLKAEVCQSGVALEQVVAAIHPQDRERVQSEIRKSLAQGGAYQCTYRVGPAGMDGRWIEANGHVEVDADGPVRFPGVLIDVSGRIAMETDRDQAMKLLRTFTEAVPGVVYAKDLDGRMLIANQGTTRLIGKPPEEYLGKTDLEFLEDKDGARAAMENDRRIMLSGVAEQVEEEIRLPDGELGVWLSTKAPLVGADGRVEGLIGSSVDITTRKRMEAELKASQEELRRLNETLEERVSEAVRAREQAQEALRQSQKLESMGQLTGGVAHDFNNLLTPIIGGLDMLQRRAVLTERETRLVDGALQSAERAKMLVQRLLAFARRQPLQPVAVDVRALVTGMAELIASTSGPRVRVAVEAAPELPPVKADPNQLEMAILNLAVNARDAMPDGGRLTILARVKTGGEEQGVAPGRYVALSVSDTGVGMDEDTQRRAIEPFFSTKGVGKGTGLGLSMVHGLTAQLGGSLSILSRPELGTTIELLLPMAEGLDPHGEREPLALHPGKTGTALLVDDEDIVRASTADMLIELGYDVVEAESAERALRLLGDGLKPDVVVTDHLMPGLSGTDLARIVQERGPTPVLIISGYAEDEGIPPDLPRLTKPFRQVELSTALAGLV